MNKITINKQLFILCNITGFWFVGWFTSAMTTFNKNEITTIALILWVITIVFILLFIIGEVKNG